MESIEALIHEQRDLSFGRRMQSVLIWRIAKVRRAAHGDSWTCAIELPAQRATWKYPKPDSPGHAMHFHCSPR